MTYLAHPIHYTPNEFRTLLAGLKFDKGWRPSFPTLHNTGVPSLAQWLAMGATPQERWGASLNAYYKGLGWHSGVHLVCCPDYIWNLCDLEADGVSVSCWNHLTLGIEMVGNYELGGDDFETGEGAKVRDNAVFVLAALCEKFGWDIADTLHFHRECVHDHHACPGSRVAKPDIIQRVITLRGGLGDRPVVTPVSPHPLSTIDLTTVTGQPSALKRLGFDVTIDGDLGPQTKGFIATVQRIAGLPVTGTLDAATSAVVAKAVGG